MTQKIIAFNATTGQVVLRYADDAAPVAVELPINEQGLYPTGEELASYLAGFIPHIDTRRKDALAAGIANAHEIEALVIPEVPAVPEQDAPSAEALAAAEQFEQAEFDQRIQQSLARLGYVKP